MAADGTARFVVNAERPAGLNADGAVDGLDLGFLLGAWEPCP